jgi:hypothetical protein
MSPSVIGKRVSVRISEPWEFGTACGVGPFSGAIADQDESRLLVALDIPINYGGDPRGTLIGYPRHSLQLNTSELGTSQVPMNFILCSDPNLRTSTLQGSALAGSIQFAK